MLKYHTNRITFTESVFEDSQENDRSINLMAEICPTCGLPKDLCVCQEIVKEEQRIKVRVERRKWHKEMTVIEGIKEKEVDLHDLATKLKNKCACGGTAKLGRIELQGDHKEEVRGFLVQLGFPDQNIDVQ